MRERLFFSSSFIAGRVESERKGNMAKKKSTKTPSKKSPKKSSFKKSKKPSVARTANVDHSVRDHLLYLLKDGGAHTSFDAVMDNWPLQLVGAKVANFPHTAWMLLEHMRLAQEDILDFSRNAKYASQAWPEEYWPASEAPADEKAWKASMAAWKKNLRTVQQLVANRKIDLYAPIPWGDGQTILREALLVADHNAYHLGQLAMLRKSIGI
jgi:hypothetical protein